ncbi:hypothetical protein, partial [Burkholderia ubonensis]|uniref:hypothetical protein n=1 Tax=Burkholderia ubonensis TaxID=101571 RepID=UPI001C4355A3
GDFRATIAAGGRPGSARRRVEPASAADVAIRAARPVSASRAAAGAHVTTNGLPGPRVGVRRRRTGASAQGFCW